MMYRALIIAAESYPNMSGGIASLLPNTLKAGEQFRATLEEKWRKENVARVADGNEEIDAQVLFCSSPVVPGGRPATLRSIRACLTELRDTGRNEIAELYVFFSGHGFTFDGGAPGRSDYLITPDSAENAGLSPDCCASFDGMVAWLRDHLGPGMHYYFVDACRNVLSPKDVMPGPIGLPLDTDASGQPATFVLQSTNEGAVAAVDETFPGALIEGLQGKGEAKVFPTGVADTMVVHFDSLTRFVKKAMRGQTATSNHDGEVATSEAILRTFRPFPRKTCLVRVEGTVAGDTGKLFVKREQDDDASERPLTLPETKLEGLRPGVYEIGVAIAGATVTPSVRVVQRIFEDVSISFTRIAAEAAAKGGNVIIDKKFGSPTAAQGGVTVDREVVPPLPPLAVGGGLEAAFFPPAAALAAASVSPAHRSIVGMFPHTPRGVDFSESLGGEVTDMDLDVWLAILGGGRILAKRTGDYSKIGALPLCDFSREPAGASPVYVMAALAQDAALEMSVSDDARPAWASVGPVEKMAGIRHLRIETTPGPKLISLRWPSHPSRTIASLTVANRATLVTLTTDHDANVRVAQYLLPLGHLVKQLPDQIRGYVEGRSRPLNDVRTLASAGRAFRQRRDIGKEMSQDQWDELLFAKWVDPIGSSLIAYQALRHGRKQEVRGAARNLQLFFPTLPDGAALARLADGLTGPTRPPGIPLIIDGLRAYPDYADWLPLPAGLLDFSSPWTAWRGAV